MVYSVKFPKIIKGLYEYRGHGKEVHMGRVLNAKLAEVEGGGVEVEEGPLRLGGPEVGGLVWGWGLRRQGGSEGGSSEVGYLKVGICRWGCGDMGVEAGLWRQGCGGGGSGGEKL